MGVWGTAIGTAAGFALGGPLGALAGAALGGGADLIVLRLSSPERRRVAFTIAAIALAAKMARADGVASPQEFAVFERLFEVPPGERANAARFYDLAKGSTAGYEAYARQAATLLGPGSPVLEDLLEALLLIAAADGFHDEEFAFLDGVAARLGFDRAAWAKIRARHVAGGADDPDAILGVAPGADAATIRTAYRNLVKTYHPDRHIAEGMPIEFVRVAEARIAAINAAYAALARP